MGSTLCGRVYINLPLASRRVLSMQRDSSGAVKKHPKAVQDPPIYACRHTTIIFGSSLSFCALFAGEAGGNLYNLLYPESSAADKTEICSHGHGQGDGQGIPLKNAKRFARGTSPSRFSRMSGPSVTPASPSTALPPPTPS